MTSGGANDLQIKRFALSLFQSLSTQFYLLEVLIEKAVHDGVGADGGHGEQVAGGVDGQHQPVAPGGVPADLIVKHILGLGILT